LVETPLPEKWPVLTRHMLSYVTLSVKRPMSPKIA
jgi:hypothetical protein